MFCAMFSNMLIDVVSGVLFRPLHSSVVPYFRMLGLTCGAVICTCWWLQDTVPEEKGQGRPAEECKLILRDRRRRHWASPTNTGLLSFLRKHLRIPSPLLLWGAQILHLQDSQSPVIFSIGKLCKSQILCFVKWLSLQQDSSSRNLAYKSAAPLSLETKTRLGYAASLVVFHPCSQRYVRPFKKPAFVDAHMGLFIE